MSKSKSIHIDININKALARAVTKEACHAATWAALDHLAAVSKKQVPLDQGPLQNSCKVAVSDYDYAAEGVVSYDTPYAIPQHENLSYHHQRGRKAKYLEDPCFDNDVIAKMRTLMEKEFKARM